MTAEERDPTASLRRQHRDAPTGTPERASFHEPARGMEEVIDALYAACAERLYRFAMARTRDAALAEDVVSETFLRAVREAARLPAAEPARIAWLYRTAANLVVDDYRRRTREAQAARRALEERPPEKDERVRVDLWAAVERLPESQRVAVALRYGHGMKVTDVAEALGRSEGAVKQLLLRALRTLRHEVSLGAEERAQGRGQVSE